jgi:hypothetical protein
MVIKFHAPEPGVKRKPKARLESEQQLAKQDLLTLPNLSINTAVK